MILYYNMVYSVKTDSDSSMTKAHQLRQSQQLHYVNVDLELYMHIGTFKHRRLFGQ